MKLLLAPFLSIGVVSSSMTGNVHDDTEEGGLERAFPHEEFLSWLLINVGSDFNHDDQVRSSSI